MNLEFTLAGHSSPWTFPGSETLRLWLARTPWVAGGGICVLRTNFEGDVLSLLESSIERTAHASNLGSSYLSVRRVPCGANFGSPQQALLQNFGLAEDVNPIEARNAIRLALTDRPQLLLIEERAPVAREDWERFAVLIEHYCKVSPVVPLAVIVIDSRAVLACQPICQFVNGYANHKVLANAAHLTDEAVWARYLHLRAWWDAGGLANHALSLSAQLENVCVGDDHSVEQVLQTYAESNLNEENGFELLVKLFSELPRVAADTAAETQLNIELQSKHLLWAPPGLNGLHVVPWVARGILARIKLKEQDYWRLRQNLVCAPLSSEILAMSLLFESQIRTRLTDVGDPNRLTAETSDRHLLFCQGSDPWTNYPAKHPAPPTRDSDIWAFASFGEVLNACPKPSIPEMYRNIKDLRNCLAHGHYVTWIHCSLALRALRILDK